MDALDPFVNPQYVGGQAQNLTGPIITTGGTIGSGVAPINSGGYSQGGAGSGNYGADPFGGTAPTNNAGGNRLSLSVCNTPDGSCPGNAGSGAAVSGSPAQSNSAQTQPGGANVTGNDAIVTGSVNDLFIRAVIVILGLVFVAVGLTMFKGQHNIQVVTGPIKRATT